MSDKERVKTIKQELVMAEKLNEDRLESQMREAIQRYTGVYVPEIGANWDVVLNEFYPIIQYNLPSIFFRNPRVFLKPRNKNFIKKMRDPITGQMVEVFGDSQKSARTQEAILNYALSEMRYKQEVRKILMDALLFRFGVLWHGYKGNFGMTDEQSLFIKDEQVFVKRLSPMRFLKDPAVGLSCLDEARWIGRSFDVPLQDILEDNQLDVDKKMLKGKLGYGDTVKRRSDEIVNDVLRIPSRPLIDFADDEYKKSAAARFVTVYEVFLRPTPKEKREGSRGWVMLLTNDQEKPLRISKWPYKAEGWPAKILEFNSLIDEQFGLSDIDTYKAEADRKNAIANLQFRNAQENSRVWVGISKDGLDSETDLEVVKRGDNTILLFEGDPKAKMAVASPGGSGSSELYLIDQRIDRSLQDKSGVTDLKKGFLQSGEESATSVKMRSLGGSARPSYRQDLMADFLKESCHFINQLLKQFYPIDKAVRIVGSLDLEWSDNPSKEEIQADVDVEIDVISMLPENPEKELQELNMVLNLMIQGLTVPQVAAKLAQEGKTINLAPVIEQILMRLKVRDPDVFRNIEPDESQGFVSVQQVREAKDNVLAAVSGQPIPHPPKMEDDHVAKLELYTTMSQLFQAMGQVSDAIEQLIQAHQLLIEELQKKESPKEGQSVNLEAPFVESIGAK